MCMRVWWSLLLVAAVLATTAVPASARTPTRLTLTVNGVAATDTATDHSHSHVTGGMFTVGTPLHARAVTDAPLPRGWLLHIIRPDEKDPKTGGWLEICHTVAPTCRVTRQQLNAAGDDVVYAQVLAPTGQVLYAQVTITWELKLTLTVNRVTARDMQTRVTDDRHKYATGTSTVGTPLQVRAVTDASRLPRGWLLHVIRPAERDPKTGGWLEICRTVAPTCRVTRPGLTMAGDDVVYATVSAPTYNVLSAQVLLHVSKS